jgi:hypothetical protein
MATVTVGKIIDEFESLKGEDKEYTFSVLSQKMVQERRRAIARRAREARNNYSQKKTKSGSAADLVRDLTNDYAVLGCWFQEIF